MELALTQKAANYALSVAASAAFADFATFRYTFVIVTTTNRSRAMPSEKKPMHDVCIPANIGRRVRHWGREWKIIGINYLGNYDIERYEDREDGRYRIESSCVLGLPVEHPHYAVLCEEPPHAE